MLDGVILNSVFLSSTPPPFSQKSPSRSRNNDPPPLLIQPTNKELTIITADDFYYSIDLIKLNIREILALMLLDDDDVSWANPLRK